MVLRERIAKALNGRAFTRIRLAKQTWQLADNKKEAEALLSSAADDASAALKIKSDEPVFLGNRGYSVFLLGKKPDAEPILRRALELGGEKLRDGELEDAEIHPLPQDKEFKELINRLWVEVSRKKGGDGKGESKSP